MNIREYVNQFDYSFDEIKSSYKKEFEEIFSNEDGWLSNLEDKTHRLESESDRNAINDVISKLKSSSYKFSTDDIKSLSIFRKRINTIVRIANRINNFKQGTELDDGTVLNLPDLFNEIKGSEKLANVEITLNRNLENFLPHLYSVVKHCQNPLQYPIYYKYWKNILREVLDKSDDYDNFCHFYRTFPEERRHLHFAAYLGAIGKLIIQGLNSENTDIEKDTSEYKYLTNEVVNIERYYSDLELNNTSTVNEPEGDYSTKYYLVGSYWKRSEDSDQTNRFISNGIWENGYDDKFLEEVNSVDVGSKIAIKSAYTRNKSNSVMAIKAIGVVTGNPKDGKRLEVDWESDFESFEVDFSGGHWSTISEVTNQDHIQKIWYVEQKKSGEDMHDELNVIFYGPPGTGKTYTTIKRAAEIVEGRKFENYNDAKEAFHSHLHEEIEFITFHQNYSYEDFIQGLRPDTENDKELTFDRVDGLFKKLADKAFKNYVASKRPQTKKKSFEEVFNAFINPLVEGEVEELEVEMKRVSYFITAVTNRSIEFRKASGGTAHSLSISTLKRMYEAESVMEIQGLSSYYSPLLDKLLEMGKSPGETENIERKNYVLIIDEINRANISRVFGELITLIEPDKRYGREMHIPASLASGESFSVPENLYIIGTMNTADKSIALLDIALRRRFEFEAMYPQYKIDGEKIHDVDVLRKINDRIKKLKGHDFQIGHSYFMKNHMTLEQRMNRKVIPLLLEYFMNDEKEVKEILKHADLDVIENSWPLEITESA